MRLTRLTLTNFRAFEDFTLDLAPGFTFIVGVNGSGKSTLMDALAVALGAPLRKLSAQKPLPPDIDPDRHVRYELKEDASDGVLRRDRIFPTAVAVEAELLGARFSWERRLQSRTSPASTYDSASPVAALLDEEAHPEVTLPMMAYYPTERLWDRGGAVGGDELPSTRIGTLRGALPVQDLLSGVRVWWANAEAISNQDDRPFARLVCVKAAARGALSLKADPWYAARHKDIVVPTEGGLRRLKDLSDGQRTMLALFADIARRAADLNPHLGARAAAETPGVVLIDEIDMHLHPAWQRQVVDLLRAQFPKMQFIVGTHAPQVLTDARPGEIRILRQRDGAQPEVHSVDIPPGLTADQVLTGPWYDLSTTTDDDTVDLIREQAELYRLTDPSQEQLHRREEIARLLRRRLDGWDDTSEERLVRGIVAQLQAERPAFSAEERADLRRFVLERLREKSA